METASILVADDQQTLTLAIQTRLSAEGYTVSTCADGYQALAKARKELPDLIILDIHMPAGSGFSVLDRMRTVPELQETPVILITGDSSPETMVAAQKYGIDYLLKKPFSSQDLIAYVRAALGSISLQH